MAKSIKGKIQKNEDGKFRAKWEGGKKHSIRKELSKTIEANPDKYPKGSELELINEEDGSQKLFCNGEEVPPDETEAQKKREKEARKAEEEARLKAEEEKRRKEEKEEKQKKQQAMAQKNQPRGGGRSSKPQIPDHEELIAEQFFLPQDSKGLIKLTSNGANIDNYHLKFNRFAQFQKDNKEALKSHNVVIKEDGTVTYPLAPPSWDKDNKDIDYSAINTLHQQQAETLFRNEQKTFQVKTAWRLNTGLGGSSVYETGLTLHHIYGIPFLPSSGLKGVMRSYVLQNANFRCSEDKIEETAMKDEAFRIMFGSTELETTPEGHNIPDDYQGKKLKSSWRGGLCLWDALPTKPPELQPDIMNPHYEKYYKGEKPPQENQSPIPIYFLTVKGTFQIIMGWQRNEALPEHSPLYALVGEKKEQAKPNSWLSLAKQLIVKALDEEGFGAKTNAGYGQLTSPINE